MQPGYRAYKCRLYPKPHQEAYFRLMFKACRNVYNHFLEVRKRAYDASKSDPSVRIPTQFDMCRMLTSYKKTELDSNGRPWLADVDSTALVYEIQHLNDAFVRFFRRIRKGDSAPGFPRPKWGGDRDSATVAFKRPDFAERGRIRFAKIGWVDARCWREIEGVPISCTVSVDAAGRWWASILCRDVPPSEPPEPMEPECVVRLGAAAMGPLTGSDMMAAVSPETASERESAGREADAPDASGCCPATARACGPGAEDARGASRRGPAATGGMMAAASSGAVPGGEATGLEAVAAEARELKAKRRRRREERKLERRRGTVRKGSATSRRYLEQDRKVALMRAHEADGARTRAHQEAAAIARSAARVVVEGEPATPQEKELLAALEAKCRQWGREFVRRG